MVFLVNMIRTFIGGKTELGISLGILAGIAYITGLVPWLDSFEELTAILKVVGMLTGVALLTRVEDKKGMLKALQSLFSTWRR